MNVTWIMNECFNTWIINECLNLQIIWNVYLNLVKLKILKSLEGFYDGLAFPPPLVLFASTLVPPPCPV